MKEQENLNAPKLEHNNQNWFCKTFGHKFITVSDYERKPLTGDEIFKTLDGIKRGVLFASVEMNLQNKVHLYTEKSTHTKTYCKRCGLTL